MSRLQTTACPPNYRFTGYEYDSETGLNYAFARYYSARLGRFLSTDPLGGSVGSLQSHNAYAYTSNNPLNFIDPSGMNDCEHSNECHPTFLIGLQPGMDIWGEMNNGCWYDFWGGDCGAENRLTWGFATRSDFSLLLSFAGCSFLSESPTCGNFFELNYFDYSGRGRGVEDIDRQRLTKCLKDTYKIDLINFVQSADGSNGFFSGKDSAGKVYYVENNVGSYTMTALSVLAKHSGTIGYTSNVYPFSANVNYTASDLKAKGFGPEFITNTQVHELAHSLDILTHGGNPFASSEPSADSFEACVLGIRK